MRGVIKRGGCRKRNIDSVNTVAISLVFSKYLNL
jgi:hypothetical protein